MKKILFLNLLLPVIFYSQELMSDNFDSYATGPVSTDLTGTSPGASGYYVNISGGGTSSNLDEYIAQFQEFNGSNALQLNTPNGSGGLITLKKDGLDTAWNSRTPGNDIITAAVDFTPTTSMGKGIYIMSIVDDSGYSYPMAGVAFRMYDMKITGYCRINNNGTINNYYITYPINSSVIMSTGTTYHVEISYDKSNQKMKLRINGANPLEMQTAIDPMANPNELKIYTFPRSDNTASDTGYFDNLSATATNLSLGIDEIEDTTTKSSIYPIPLKNQLNIDLSDNFDASKTSIHISDINGKNVMNSSFQENIDVSTFVPGIYFITITDGINVENQKLIKE